MHLIDEVEHILDENNYTYSEYSGCFNIVARKKGTLLLKVLDNVDSFQVEQSKNLKTLSVNLTSSAFLIGNHTRRENLKDNVVYERFGVSTVTSNTFENILAKEMPTLYRNRGGLFAEINPEKLKQKRAEAGLSQSQLAEKVGVGKKSIYEHESRQMKADHDIVKKIEKLIGDVTSPLTTKTIEATKTNPKDAFQHVVSKDLKGMGLETNFVNQSPFNILAGSENFLVMSDAEARAARAEKNAPFLKEFAETTKKPILVVTRDELDMDVPSIIERELRDLDNMQELRRFLRRW